MGAKELDEVAARGIAILENLDVEMALVKVARQISVEVVHVIQTPTQFGDWLLIIVDADEQCVDFVCHGSGLRTNG